MTIRNVTDIVDAELAGRVRRYTYRKTPSQATTAGVWFDLAMSPGNPVPKYWFDAPSSIAKAISQSADGGVFHGANTTPEQQYARMIVTQASASTALPMTMILCDYLLYYPTLDDSILDPQIMDNTVTLPRYTNGEGVMAVAISVAGRTGGQSFSFLYTNQDGVKNRQSATVVQNAVASLGTVVTSSTATLQSSGNPFIGLQDDDRGIQSIERVTMNGADVGLFTIILVKPILQTTIKEITAPYEKDMFIHGAQLPEIEDDAYLNFLCLPQGSLAATALIGDLKVIWG